MEILIIKYYTLDYFDVQRLIYKLSLRLLLTKRIRIETTLRHFNHRSKSREKLETAWKREILPGYFLRDDSRTIGCPAAFYASAKPTPRSPRNPLINPPPRNVRKIAIPPDTFALFLASLARTSVFPLLPFPNFFLPFSLPRNVSPPPIAAAQFGTHCQDPIELPTRIFADRSPKVYRSHWSRCFLLIETSYVTCARVHGLIKPRAQPPTAASCWGMHFF